MVSLSGSETVRPEQFTDADIEDLNSFNEPDSGNTGKTGETGRRGGDSVMPTGHQYYVGEDGGAGRVGAASHSFSVENRETADWVYLKPANLKCKDQFSGRSAGSQFKSTAKLAG